MSITSILSAIVLKRVTGALHKSFDGQSAFATDGRTNFVFIVTKLGCRNGAATWAESSGVPFGRAGVLGQASLPAC